jgi:hypothetical protein
MSSKSRNSNKSQSKSQSRSRSKSQSKSQSRSRSKSQSKSQSRSKSQSKSQSRSRSKSQSKSQSGSRSKSQSGSRSKSQSRSRSRSRSSSPKLSSKSKKRDYSELIVRKKSKKKSTSSYSLSSLKIVKIKDSEDKTPFLLFPKKGMVNPKVWELPNRKRFYNWVPDTFQKYDYGRSIKKKSKSRMSIEDRNKALDKLSLNNIQRLTRDFMQGESPYRGLLLYLGLGVGKTCAAIAIAEAIHNRKEVLILSKTSLEDNFMNDGIPKCGADYMTKNNHWVFSKCNTEEEEQLAKDLHIPDKIIQENGGMFLIDFTNLEPNYDHLSRHNIDKLNRQLEETIRHRYKFLHTDATRKTPEMGDFDNKVIIVDEVHNLINTITNGTARAKKFYDCFMKAKNAKIIFLTGTPLVNTIYESVFLFNILRGYIPTFTVKIKTTFDIDIQYNKIKNDLHKIPHVDQVIINKVSKTIKVTKTPENFITTTDNKGVVYAPMAEISLDVFTEQIETVFKKLGYKMAINYHNETCLPEDKNAFEQLFYNVELNKIKKTDLIKRRIAGLTSYYQYQDKTKFPELKSVKLELIPFSIYQLSKYEKYRHQEKKENPKEALKGTMNEKVSSSYRIKSRLACTFVFPEETGSPYEDKKIEILEQLGTKLDELGEPLDADDLVNEKKVDSIIKSSFLKILDKEKDKYLDIHNGSLKKLSPKYLKMVQNIIKSPGSNLVYSQFRTLIGLAVFGLVLEQTGRYAPLRLVKEGGEWRMKENEGEEGLPKYCYYSGKEDREEREIARKIFNSMWDELPSNCDTLKKQVIKMDKSGNQNLYGDIIKVFMITKTGAEGLNLKCVRSVHIMESYWQPVLIEQIIGRAVRTESHIRLPHKDRNVEVFIYMMTFTPELTQMISYADVRQDTVRFNDEALGKKGQIVSTDEYLYVIAERKKKIVNEYLHLMKESAFDCQLNYHDNRIESSNIVCLDYETQNRDDYLYTSDLNDTIDIIDLKQEKLVTDTYKAINIKGKTYFYNPNADFSKKVPVYNEKIKTSVKKPKPVGYAFLKEGKLKFAFKKK